MGVKRAALAIVLCLGVGAYLGTNPLVVKEAQSALHHHFGGALTVVTPTTGKADVTPAPIPVTTDNAPPATPMVLDGIHVKYNPYMPSDGAYPNLALYNHVWIDVSIDQQLVYILSGDKVLYTMVTSSGIGTNSDNGTPLGVYHVQAERGTWFYSNQYQMGAQYWVSWLDHGVFLFHSVPEDQNQKVLPQIAADMGQKASHGCFHLTIPDAKWVYDNIPEGTTVVVEQEPVALQGGVLYHPTAEQLAAESAVSPAGANPSTGITSSQSASAGSVNGSTTS